MAELHLPAWPTKAKLPLACALAALLAGCCQLPPIHLSPVQLKPLHLSADAQVTAELPITATSRPLVAMPLPGSCLEPTADRIAVVDVDGLLLNSDLTGLYSMGENPVSLFRERLDAVRADQAVRAVVLRINSPGGGATACDIMWHDLQQFRRDTNLPVTACLLDVGAGGAYLLASGADRIVAHPTSVAGGVGVILNLYNLQDAMAQFNVVANPIKAGQNIDLGTPIAALTDERKQLLQVMADEFHDRFQQQVLEARPEVDAQDQTNFDGRVFTAQQALARGLIDQVGYLDDAVAWCRGPRSSRPVQLVMYHRPNDPARTPLATSPNTPLQGSLLPLSLPGLDRSRLPSFLYLWQPDPTLEKLGGK